MKRTIFLPTFCLAAFLALLSVISCDKTLPADEGAPLDDGPQKFELTFEDQNWMQVEDLVIRQGDKVPIEVLKEKAPDFFWNSIAPNIYVKSSRRDIDLDTIANWGVATYWNQTCNCGPENCPLLGQELQGIKNGNWIQVDSEPQSHWWGSMTYEKDPKSLTDYGTILHLLRHINYNSKGSLQVSWWVYDPDLPPSPYVHFIDIDGPVSVPDYGLYTWFTVYNEDVVLTGTGNQENAITNFYTSCSSCDSCD